MLSSLKSGVLQDILRTRAITDYGDRLSPGLRLPLIMPKSSNESTHLVRISFKNRVASWLLDDGLFHWSLPSVRWRPSEVVRSSRSETIERIPYDKRTDNEYFFPLRAISAPKAKCVATDLECNYPKRCKSRTGSGYQCYRLVQGRLFYCCQPLPYCTGLLFWYRDPIWQRPGPYSLRYPFLSHSHATLPAALRTTASLSSTDLLPEN